MSDNQISKIKRHWEEMAQSPKDADGLRPTARDPYLQSVVETAMERHLTPGARLLDLGCGDGRSTLRFLKTTGYAVGIDYVVDFVKIARLNAAGTGAQNIFFEPADVQHLEPIQAKFGRFDLVTSIRCLINLPDWDCQARALGQISRLVRPGGLYLVSEGWLEGFEGLNVRRRQARLADMQVAQYNCFISRRQFEAEVNKYFEVEAYENLGLYLFLSRLVQPLFTAPAPPSHTHHLNEIAADLVNAGIGDSAFESCDYSGVYVLRRLDD